MSTEIITAPPIRLYLDTREVDPATVDDGIPTDLDAADRLLRALLVGRNPGTRGRLDVYAYPERRGAHAYRAERCYLVDRDGTPVPVAGPGEHAAAIASAEHATGHRARHGCPVHHRRRVAQCCR